MQSINKTISKDHVPGYCDNKHMVSSHILTGDEKGMNMIIGQEYGEITNE